MLYQSRHTLCSSVSISGIGLHSGVTSAVTLRPAPAQTGIIFRRMDLLCPHTKAGLEPVGQADLAAITIDADVACVCDTLLGTSLQNQTGASVRTIEHLMAALAICGVDDVIIDLTGEEIPILDGSAEQFVDAIRNVGLAELACAREFWAVREAFSVRLDDRWIKVEPADYFDLDVEILFEDSAIGRQSISLSFDDAENRERMAMARTFCELDTARKMADAGLCKGGSEANAIIVDKGELLHNTTLRDPMEFVLHKALDLIGDMSLMGMPVLGRVSAYKPGHELNTLFASALRLRAGEIVRMPERARDDSLVAV